MKRRRKNAAQKKNRRSDTQKLIRNGYQQLSASLRRAKLGFEIDRLNEAAAYQRGVG